MSKDTNVSGEHNRDGPDYFGYYTCQVQKLLSQDEDFQLFVSSKASEFSGKESCQVKEENDHGASCSLFGNGVGNELSDFKRERLRTLLLQGVNVLTPEVDEMLYPVVQMRGVQMHRRNRKESSSLAVAANKDGPGLSSCKKLKISPSSPQLASPNDSGSNVAPKISVNGTTGPEESKVNDDDHRQVLIENDSPEVEEILQSVSDELSSKLGYMDQQLEELLNVVASVCRPMTVPEKIQLQKMIKELPPKNLERVVELIAHAEKRSHDEINVDLEKESNTTLWRLYYYVQAVEKAKMLSQ